VERKEENKRRGGKGDKDILYVIVFHRSLSGGERSIPGTDRPEREGGKKKKKKHFITISHSFSPGSSIGYGKEGEKI